jgi:hypothetical protein
MGDENWVVVDDVVGMLMGDLLCGLLKAKGVYARHSQEAISDVIPVTIGPLAHVQILAPAEEAEQAREILAAYYAGEYEDMQFPGESLEGEGEEALGDEEE